MLDRIGTLWSCNGDSLLRRGSKGFFSSGVDPLSNVSAGTEFTGDGGKRGSLCQIPHPRWPPSGGDNFQWSTLWGGLSTLCHGKDGGQDLRFSDV